LDTRQPSSAASIFPQNKTASPWAISKGDWRGGKELARRLVEKWDPFRRRNDSEESQRRSKGFGEFPLLTIKNLQAWSTFRDKHGRVTVFLVLLRAAALPARAVEGLELVESITTPTLIWFMFGRAKSGRTFSRREEKFIKSLLHYFR